MAGPRGGRVGRGWRPGKNGTNNEPISSSSLKMGRVMTDKTICAWVLCCSSSSRKEPVSTGPFVDFGIVAWGGGLRGAT